MTCQSRTRRWVAALLVGLTLITAGCTDEPKPEPPPPPTYQQPPADTCQQVALQDILQQRWQLSLPSDSIADPYYDASSPWTYVRCDFTGVAEDGRYATVIPFRPSGAVGMRIYSEVADAVDYYDREAESLRKRAPSIDPGGSVTEISGWWDTGISVKLVTRVDSGPLGLEDPGTTEQARELLVRHDNLVVRSTVNANAPTSDRAEVAVLLDEIAAVLLDESVKHLPRTNG